MDHAMNGVTPVWYFNAEKPSIAVKHFNAVKPSIAVKHFNAVKHFIVMKCREVTVICARSRG
jgi:hypothetical protein